MPPPSRSFFPALLTIPILLAACGAHRPEALMRTDKQTLPADGVSLTHVTLANSEGRKPSLKIREGARYLHIEALTASGPEWQATLRAGILPANATLEATVEPGTPPLALTFQLTPVTSDREADGTPDFLRLDSAEDRQAFRQWFRFLAESQYFRSPLPPDIVDCAALIRYAYREALRFHDDAWSDALHLRMIPAIPGVTKYQYPYTPLAANLFRVRAGAFTPADAQTIAFAQFADAKTLRLFNTHFVTKEVQRAIPGDVLFFRQREQKMPFHTMIFIGASQVDRTPGPYLLYHTGPSGRSPGEIRRVPLSDLEHHPEPRWRPFPANDNFLGVYRWNIL